MKINEIVSLNEDSSEQLRNLVMQKLGDEPRYPIRKVIAVFKQHYIKIKNQGMTKMGSISRDQVERVFDVMSNDEASRSLMKLKRKGVNIAGGSAPQQAADKVDANGYSSVNKLDYDQKNYSKADIAHMVTTLRNKGMKVT